MRLTSKKAAGGMEALEIEADLDEEDVPLVASRGKNAPPPLPAPPTSSRVHLAVIVLLGLTAVLLFWTTRVAEVESEELPEDSLHKDHNTTHDPNDALLFCKEICQERREKRLEHYGGDLMSINDTIKIFEAARRRFIGNLQAEYGHDTYYGLFENDDNEFSKQGCFYPGDKDGGKSMTAAVRKLKIKLLETRLGVLESDKAIEGCNCVEGDSPLDPNRKGFNATGEYLEVDSRYSRFLWVTGGHSASAGHGNLYNETYTSFLERGLKEVFEPMGISVEARNFAMGGTSSGFEISSCSAQIFGNDMDALSWDYGMTDGKDTSKLMHYFYRASLSKTFPIMFGIAMGASRAGAMEALANHGLPSFPNSESCTKAMTKAIPDSSLLKDEEIASLPPLVRNYRCGESLEKGDPYCGSEKFSQALCSDRKGKTSWHPGWKHHAMDGYRMAVFWVSVMRDALDSLKEDLESKTAEDILTRLKTEEEIAYLKFLNNPVLSQYNMDKPDDVDGFDYDAFFKGQSICRTARLPAMARFLGYTTNTEMTGYIAVAGEEEFDMGIPQYEAEDSEPNGRFRLVQEKRHPGCPVVLNPDHKDFFYINTNDGWQSLLVPNEMERAAYSYDPSRVKGMVFLCPAVCDWGKCPKGDVRLDQAESGTVEILINGIPVVDHKPYSGCFLLKGEDGWTFPQVDANGIFELRARVVNSTTTVGQFRISSLVIY